MKKTIMLAGIVFVLIFAIVQANAAFKYVGVAKCKTCHTSEKSGKAFPIWEKSKHAKAYEALATPEAMAVAKKLNIENPQTSDQCLGCHVTGFAAEKALKDSTLTMKEGISCEACHGAGSEYKSMAIMKDKTKAIAAGLAMPTEKTCVGCHNDKSPTFKEFKFADMAKLIAHPIQKAATTTPAEKKG